MTKNKKKLFILKNKQDKFLPFLKHQKDILETKYYPLNNETKVLLEEQNAKRKSKRKKIWSIAAFGINLTILAVILIVQLSGDSSTVLAPAIDWRFMAVIIGMVALFMIIDSLKIFILIKVSTKKSRPFLSFKTSALGKYYDNITPMATGGQPFQIFYMNKRGVRGDIATGIPLMKYITWQITYVFVCVFALVYNGIKYGGTADPFITTVAWIATLVNLIIFLTIISLSISKKFGPKLVIWILKLLAKLHIVKNYRKTFRKVMRFVVNYQKTFKTLLKNPLVLISEFFLSFADIIVFNLIPYFIVRTFVSSSVIEAQNITVFKTFIQSLICALSLGFIPTPGASGGAEGVFLLVFGGIFSKSGLFWPLLIWRVATYYYPILQGLFVLVYDFAIGNRKAEKLKKAGAAIYNENESKGTFRESLESNLQTIEVVQLQEQDTIPTQVFTGANLKYEGAEIIENSSLVSSEEMDERVKPVEQLIAEIDERENKRKQKKTEKKLLRKENKKKNN